ncbi:uncharacterized protein DSM5745_07586 [Aspergillus mulundensis]|uniref:Uncharacterized protein n=1 Tax=Aspergillus mulundensis TaxID=1810919 RepID=A0A3D8REW8_9EURO|nr:hypothetical protein DSM5745_07586 [Aspergillus mulundensis]RDW72414.1 hypothetical protein DSM5745_07586 [Aspergillus mulundensis]
MTFQVFDRCGTVKAKSKLVGESDEHSLTLQAQAENEAIRFWRVCGFRRIGASHWFAFLFDSQHPSRALAAASDFDPRRDNKDDPEEEACDVTFPFTKIKRRRAERLRDSLRLHHAALTLEDDELRAFFVAFSDDKTGWDEVTGFEATLLHLTACEFKPLSTQWLLENVAQADSWKAARDIGGYTPLEALKDKLETMRTQKRLVLSRRTVDASDYFRRFPDTAVSCLSLLSGQDTPVPNDECLRNGCTCGECVGGSLSARMRL